MAQAMRRSLWIPWLFAAGLGLVVAVNGVLIYFATGSAVGVVVDRREKDGAWRAGTAQAERQALLGWRVAVSWAGDRVLVRVDDNAGRPMPALSVAATFVRPVEGTVLPLLPLRDTGTGGYEGLVVLPSRGQWDVTVSVERGAERFVTTERIVTP